MAGKLVILVVLVCFVVAEAGNLEDAVNFMKQHLCESDNEELIKAIGECEQDIKAMRKDVDPSFECFSGKELSTSEEEAWFCDTEVEEIIEVGKCFKEKEDAADNADEIKEVAKKAQECFHEAFDKYADK